MAKSAKKRTRGKETPKPKRKKVAAKTSLKAQAMRPHEEDHIDGCDVEFREDEATLDAELPAATGGVEVIGRRRP